MEACLLLIQQLNKLMGFPLQQQRLLSSRQQRAILGPATQLLRPAQKPWLDVGGARHDNRGMAGIVPRQKPKVGNPNLTSA